MSWADWPASERTGGPPASPIDEPFLGKWTGRLNAHRGRAAVPGVLVDTLETPTYPVIQTPVGQLGELYVPPWAYNLTASCRVVVSAGVGGANGYVAASLKVGFTSGTFVHYYNLSTFESVSANIVVTLAYQPGLWSHRDQVVGAQWEYYNFRESGSFPASIAFRYYALNPTRRLPWYWSAVGL